MAWQDQAKCQGEDTEWFYPPRDSGTYKVYADKARSVCLGGVRCPVIKECLLYSLRIGEDYGVWGGMSSRERKALMERRTLPDFITEEDLKEFGRGRAEELTEEVPGHEEEADGHPGGC